MCNFVCTISPCAGGVFKLLWTFFKFGMQACFWIRHTAWAANEKWPSRSHSSGINICGGGSTNMVPQRTWYMQSCARYCTGGDVGVPQNVHFIIINLLKFDKTVFYSGGKFKYYKTIVCSHFERLFFVLKWIWEKIYLLSRY